MTATIAGAEIEKSRIDVVTLLRTAWVWITAPSIVAAAVGDTATVTTGTGAPVLTGEVVKVERSRRHQRIIVRPAVLVDMTRRMVDPVTLQDVAVPDVLAAALGPHAVTALQPFDSLPVPLWSTRTRTQRWTLESVMRMVDHTGSPVTWRYSARDDTIYVFAPGDTSGRQEHTVTDALLARGGAVEVSATANAVEAGDVFNGRPVKRVDTCWAHARKRSLVYTS